jgi:hypothetical protein
MLNPASPSRLSRHKRVLKLALKGIVLIPGIALLSLFLFLYLSLLVTTSSLSALQIVVYLGIPVVEAAVVVGVFMSAKRNQLDWTLPVIATVWVANIVNIIAVLFRVFGI